MLYQMQEGYLTLEGEWRDRSINMLAAAHLPVRGANLTITRESLPPGVEFADYMGNQKRTIAKELTGFQAHADNPDSIDGLPAHFFEFSWQNNGIQTQQMVMVINLDGQVLSLTGTIPGNADETTREALVSAMRGFRFGAAPVEREGGTT
jgi:hypothetical protein